MAKLLVNIGIPMVDLTVFLPEVQVMQAHKGEKLPVLWLYHDYGENSENWSRYTLIENELKDKFLAVICPTGHTSFYSNMDYPWRWKWFEITGQKLLTYCRHTFPLSSDPKDNYIAGYGMGGYGALLQALHYPAQYSFAASCNGFLDAADRYAKGERDQSICPDIFEADQQTASSKYSLFKQLQTVHVCPALHLTCDKQNVYSNATKNFYESAKAAGHQAEFIESDNILSANDWICSLIQKITP